MTKIKLLLKYGLKKFWASETGGVLIYFAFGLPMLLGAMALSIDLGRAFILNTELKDFSDAAALAGAAELDGRNGARVAAELAARSGLSGTLVNVQAFATDGSGPNIQIEPGPNGVVFLRNLPADGTDFTVNDTATTDANARFIFVSVVNRNVRSGLSRALGVIPDFDTGAKSIAGFASVVCRIPAMMMCNPLEDGTYAGTTLGCDLNDAHYGPPSGGLEAGWVEHETCIMGAQVLMKTAGQGAGYNPGEFGLLDPPIGNQGAKNVAEMIATAGPAFCIQNSADLRTGQAMGPVVNALNVRFDMYNQMFSGGKNNSDYRPALNVVKGHTGNGCGSSDAEDLTVAHPYPRDTCFAAGTCYDNRFGDGNWYTDTAGVPETEPYWAVNHPGMSVPADYHPTAPGLADGMTRHEVYRHEIEVAGIPNNENNPNPPYNNAGENANPECFMNGVYNPDDIPDPTNDVDTVGINETDRRVIVMAVVNCREYQLAEGGIQGSEEDVPTIGFIKLFLTEPICKPGESCLASGGTGSTQADVYVELNGKQEPGDNDAFRDIVQLYR